MNSKFWALAAVLICGSAPASAALAWQRGQSPSPLSAPDLADWKSNFGSSATRWTSINNVSKQENRINRTTLFTFTVTLSAAFDEPVSMSYRTVDGTATTDDGDYIPMTGTLTFAPGETSKTITVEVKGDNNNEGDEFFYLDLFDLSSNSLFTTFRGIGTILNDD